MSALLKAGLRSYLYTFNILADRRSDDLFLMKSVWYPLLVIAAYLYFVLWFGPKWMRKRKPFKIEPLIKIYNILQLFLCAYVIERSFTLGWGRKYRWFCEPVDYSNTPENYEVLKAVWFYTMLKLIDLLDTVFFVLRKKESQVSFLHVYHHAGVFFGSWCITRFLPGGHGTFIGFINSFVHIVMYFYYFVTMQWPEYRKQLWWKKYITQLQMVQFLMVTLHSLPALFLKECNYPRAIAGIMVLQYSFMFFLFLDFYCKAYGRKKV